LFAVVCLAAFSVASAQSPTPARKPSGTLAAPQVAAKTQLAAPQVPLKDLPVRKVVLYKNGVGYFEHSGSVTGNQRVAIDFTSSQLNDVLQSLTVLDEGGGRIAGVNYNSTTPLAEQLKTLALGMTDDPTSSELFQALRGQRVEVTGAPGGTITGRLLSIESRSEKTGSGDNSTTVDKFYLSIVASTGAVRVIELTPTLSVRPLDAGLQSQVDRYLELLSSTHATGLRHLTLNALGQGERQLRVSYISEVPVWKSTYRIVFPRSASGDAANAIVQGWAVVDNTVGADWDNVQLSLVAGSPQSFIQPLSQPLYTRRPEIAIATGVETTPQTHEAGEDKEFDRIETEAKLFTPKSIPRAMAKSVVEAEAPPPAPTNFGVAGMAGMGGSSGGSMGGPYTGGVNRPTDIDENQTSTNAFDDFFEYSLTQPVTIHKNESAMVPILQQELPAEHVTLWSPAERSPLRAIWLENKSKVTLDSGSFSIFENGEFAGEGLLDPIHPGEKRLLSYAADQAVKVHRGNLDDTRTLHHIAMHEGILVETTGEVTDGTYTIRNGADEARTVIVEHPRKAGADLVSDEKPAETTATAYRFRKVVQPHETVDLKVRERANLDEKIRIDAGQDYTAFLVTIGKFSPDLEAKLQPLIAAERTLSDLNAKLAELEQKQKQLSDDEARDRENVTALKGNEAGKRFVDELGHAEDELQAARKDHADLEKSRDLAIAKLDAAISQVSFDTDVTIATPEKPVR
jgi:hypothetical protein